MNKDVNIYIVSELDKMFNNIIDNQIIKHIDKNSKLLNKNLILKHIEYLLNQIKFNSKEIDENITIDTLYENFEETINSLSNKTLVNKYSIIPIEYKNYDKVFNNLIKANRNYKEYQLNEALVKKDDIRHYIEKYKIANLNSKLVWIGLSVNSHVININNESYDKDDICEIEYDYEWIIKIRNYFIDNIDSEVRLKRLEIIKVLILIKCIMNYIKNNFNTKIKLESKSLEKFRGRFNNICNKIFFTNSKILNAKLSVLFKEFSYKYSILSNNQPNKIFKVDINQEIKNKENSLKSKVEDDTKWFV